MEGSAAPAPSSSTAASDSAPATPASVEQLDKGQVSGPLERGVRKAGCRCGLRAPADPPEVWGESLGRAALSLPPPSCARGGACRPPALRPGPPGRWQGQPGVPGCDAPGSASSPVGLARSLNSASLSDLGSKRASAGFGASPGSEEARPVKTCSQGPDPW